MLAQSRDDGLDVYRECLSHDGFGVIDVSDHWRVLAGARHADVIVMDTLLPGSINGLEVIERLRQHEQTCRTPIIVVTHCGWQSERSRARQAGCTAFLPKPCAPATLLRQVRLELATSRFWRA